MTNRFFLGFAFLMATTILFRPNLAGQTPVPPSAAIQASDSSPAAETTFVLTTAGILQEGIAVDRGETLFLRMPDRSASDGSSLEKKTSEKTPRGGLTISKLDILFIGKTRREVFDFQRKNLTDGDVGDLVKLADWSSRNQLAPEAILLLRETLGQTVDPVAREALVDKIEQMEYVEKIKAEGRRRLEAAQSKQTASAESIKTPEETRLDEVGKNVPISLQEKFVRRVQPILLRRCAAADCHRAGSPPPDDSAGLFLVEPNQYESMKAGNLRNLEAILRRIDFSVPNQSPILNHPSVADEVGNRIYPFGNDKTSLKDYQTFAEWVFGVPGKLKTWRPAPLPDGLSRRGGLPSATKFPVSEAEVSPDDPFGAMAEEAEAENSDGKESFSADERPISEDLTADDPTSLPATKTSPIQRGGATESSAGYVRESPNDDEVVLRRSGYLPKNPPLDEFDPEPFNRKYHPDRFSSSSTLPVEKR